MKKILDCIHQKLPKDKFDMLLLVCGEVVSYVVSANIKSLVYDDNNVNSAFGEKMKQARAILSEICPHLDVDDDDLYDNVIRPLQIEAVKRNV
jgi:hypothetical protein